MKNRSLIKLLSICIAFAFSCSQKDLLKSSGSYSEASINLLGLDTALWLNIKEEPENQSNSDFVINPSVALRIVGESTLNLSKRNLSSAYSTSSGLLKSCSKVKDSLYWQIMFHHFIIANEVDSLAECKRILSLAGDSSDAGLTWIWQQTYLWMRLQARLWNSEEYEKQKNKLIDLIKQHQNWKSIAGITYEQLGNYESIFRKPQSAYNFYKEAINYFKLSGWKKREYLCKLRFADQLLADGHLSNAWLVYNEIPDVKLKWPELHCIKLLLLAEFAFRSHDRSKERNYLLELYHFANTEKLKFWATEAATRMSSWHQESKGFIQKDSVLYYAKLTYKNALEMQDQSAVANACIDLSIAERLNGNLARAMQHAMDNWAVRRIQKNVTEEIKAIYEIVELYRLTNNRTYALAFNDSALMLLDKFPEERPFLSQVFNQRAILEEENGNFEFAYSYRKKYLIWLREGLKRGIAGFKQVQIEQLQSQVFVRSEELKAIQKSRRDYRRLNRYVLLSALMLVTVTLLLTFSRWAKKRHELSKLEEEAEFSRFQLSSILTDLKEEEKQLTNHGYKEGKNLINFIVSDWRNNQLSELKKRLQHLLKALKSI